MKKITNRLNRVKGQIDAIKENVDKNEADSAKNCQDVLYQIKAARNALQKAGNEYITNYIEKCVYEIENEDSKEKQKERIESMLQAALNM